MAGNWARTRSRDFAGASGALRSWASGLRVVRLCDLAELAPMLILATLGTDPAQARLERIAPVRIRSGNIAQTAPPIAICPSIAPHAADFRRFEGDSGRKGPYRLVSGDNWAALGAECAKHTRLGSAQNRRHGGAF